MSNAKHDENHIPTALGVLNTDGVTIKPLKINPTNKRLKIDDGTGGSDNGPEDAKHDENHVSTLLAVSSADGVTPVVLYTDSDGNLLVNTL